MPRGKIEASAAEWKDRVRRWKESGLTAAQFASQEGIARPQALSWWAYKLSHSNDKPPAQATEPRKQVAQPLKLVELKPVGRRARQDVSSGPGAIEIACGRSRIEVRAGFDEETLRRVLSVMESLR